MHLSVKAGTQVVGIEEFPQCLSTSLEVKTLNLEQIHGQRQKVHVGLGFPYT